MKYDTQCDVSKAWLPCFVFFSTLYFLCCTCHLNLPFITVCQAFQPWGAATHQISRSVTLYRQKKRCLWGKQRTCLWMPQRSGRIWQAKTDYPILRLQSNEVKQGNTQVWLEVWSFNGTEIICLWKHTKFNSRDLKRQNAPSSKAWGSWESFNMKQTPSNVQEKNPTVCCLLIHIGQGCIITYSASVSTK